MIYDRNFKKKLASPKKSSANAALYDIALLCLCTDGVHSDLANDVGVFSSLSLEHPYRAAKQPICFLVSKLMTSTQVFSVENCRWIC